MTATSNAARRTPRDPALVRARLAVYLTFFANGVGFSNLVPRYPEIVESLGISKAAFGQAVMCGSLGALVAGLAASWFVQRFTSARVASIGMVVLGVGLLGAGVAHSWVVLAASLAWAGATDAVVDVAQNAHGLRVERRWGSSIITSFHAAWSLGAVVGALMGQAVAGWGVPLPVHMGGVLLLLAGVSLVALPMTIPGPDSADHPSAAQALEEAGGAGRGQDGGVAAPRRTSRVVTVAVVIVLGLMCAAAIFPEDVTANWSSLLLTEEGVSPALRGSGLIALQTTMIVGRLLGDRVVDRLGARAVIGGGGALVAVGMGVALLTSSVPGTLVGMVVCGAGCAVAVPVAYAAADDVPGLGPGTGLTVVSWLARVILMVSPPIVGWFADAHGTWVALVYGLLGGLVMLVSWPVLRRGRRSDQLVGSAA